jgi:hypothetical protein
MACFPGDNLITLRWLNTLGGWDQFTFTAKHSHGYDISNVNLFQKDIFNNWDSEFIAGEVETETISIDASKRITVRSGGVTKDIAEGLAPIKFSINVQTVSGEGVYENQTVGINRNSFDYRLDREKNIEFNFTINLPTLQIQSA